MPINFIPLTYHGIREQQPLLNLGVLNMIKNLAQAQFFLKNLAELLSSNKTFIPKKGVFKYD